MAEKRMFTKKITASDAFLDMPVTARLLYYDLNMNADDDGFVGNPKTVVRITGAANDDLKILLAKRFILAFESGVIVIKHWKMHNCIQSDRYKATSYVEEYSSLTLNENKSYTDRIQNGNSLETQIRLGKDSIGKVSIGNDNEDVKSDPKPSKKAGAPSGTQSRVLELYSTTYESIYNHKPVIAYGRMGKTIKDIEKASSVDELEAMIKWAMKDNPWLAEVGHPCERVISSDTLNRFRATKPRQTASKKVYFDKKIHCPCCYRIDSSITILPQVVEDGYTCKCGMSGKEIREIKERSAENGL